MRRFVFLAALLVTACTGPLPGAAGGPLELTAVFDDVGNLVRGHDVVVADVVVGSVTALELTEDNRARVTLSVDDLVLPQDTVARVGQSSLLGDKYVELIRPEDTACPCLESGDTVERSHAAPEVEAVVGRLGLILASITGDDLATIVAESADAFEGRGEVFNRLFQDLAVVAASLDEQSRTFARIIDRFDGFSATLAEGDDEVDRLLVEFSGATEVLAQNREQLIGALRELTRLARVSLDESLGVHRDTTARQIAQLTAIVNEMQEGQEVIERIFVDGAAALSTGLHAISPLDYAYSYELANPQQVTPGGEGP